MAFFMQNLSLHNPIHNHLLPSLKNSKYQFTLFRKDIQYYKFCLYGFFKNLKFFEPFLILFFLEKGLTYTQIGSLYAIREIGINLLETPTGFMADALGRKRTMISSFTSYILSFIVFYLADGFWLFFGGRNNCFTIYTSRCSASLSKGRMDIQSL